MSLIEVLLSSAVIVAVIQYFQGEKIINCNILRKNEQNGEKK